MSAQPNSMIRGVFGRFSESQDKSLSARGQRPRRKLNFESLEGRELFATNALVDPLSLAAGLGAKSLAV